MTRSPKPIQTAFPIVSVEALDLEAQGIARLADEEGQSGKVIFIRGALPTEQVTYTVTREKARFAKASRGALARPLCLARTSIKSI